jgi:hypothetical protein
MPIVPAAAATTTTTTTTSISSCTKIELYLDIILQVIRNVAKHFGENGRSSGIQNHHVRDKNQNC